MSADVLLDARLVVVMRSKTCIHLTRIVEWAYWFRKAIVENCIEEKFAEEVLMTHFQVLSALWLHVQWQFRRSWACALVSFMLPAEEGSCNDANGFEDY